MFRKLKPDIRYGDIYDTDADALKKSGIKLLLFDIDNTLEPYSAPLPGERLSDWLRSLIGAGFTAGIVSNAKRERIASFVEGFPDDIRERILYTYGAAKPSRKGFLRLCAEAGADPSETAMFGDQLFTDILGGNRAGLTTVLVKPIDPGIEPPFVRFKRLIERPFL